MQYIIVLLTRRSSIICLHHHITAVYLIRHECGFITIIINLAVHCDDKLCNRHSDWLALHWYADERRMRFPIDSNISPDGGAGTQGVLWI